MVEIPQKGNLWARTKRSYTCKRRYHEPRFVRFPWKIRDNLKGTSPKYGLTKKFFSGSGCFFYPWKSGLIFWGKWHCGGVPLDSHDIYLGVAEMKTKIGIGKKKCGDSKCHPSSQKSCSSENMDVSPCISNIWGLPKMEATQQQLGFLLKMTILWCFGGTTILGNTHIAAGFKLQVTCSASWMQEKEFFLTRSYN